MEEKKRKRDTILRGKVKYYLDRVVGTTRNLTELSATHNMKKSVGEYKRQDWKIG